MGGIRTASGRQPPHHPVMQRATEGPPRDGAVRNGQCPAPPASPQPSKADGASTGTEHPIRPGTSMFPNLCTWEELSHKPLASFNHRYILDATTGRLSPARTGQAKLGHAAGLPRPCAGRPPTGPVPTVTQPCRLPRPRALRKVVTGLHDWRSTQTRHLDSRSGLREIL